MIINITLRIKTAVIMFHVTRITLTLQTFTWKHQVICILITKQKGNQVKKEEKYINKVRVRKKLQPLVYKSTTKSKFKQRRA